ncbi:Potassium efflux system KefA protein / Small-conductance mechanosensitive channel [Methylophaga frappieri]|uniref:Potassium efflux system KefA protein / Small-conductance mechanosensitive channel n=2 Tax=Methylophaga frappieri (strain ATCC BAA-2434 / DSM 25690 / JAM7) TaxID=754477 RepID=I1YFY0_METFJ|nr:Potassium efflux system KefA protein / Small-conductance mechanosensitive channel [Methylophaga frappieri]
MMRMGGLPLILTLFLSVFSINQVWADEAASGSESKLSSELLADMLENPETRQQLIDELRQQSADTPAMSEAEAEQSPSFARQIADDTQKVAQDLVSTIGRSVQAVSTLGSEQSSHTWSTMLTDLGYLFVVIAATLVVFWLVRGIARKIFFRVNQWAENTHRDAIIRRTLAIIASIIVDLIVVAIAWVAGYAVALFAVGSDGEMQITQTLFLNAFLAIEVFKVLLRSIFAPKNAGLRWLPMMDETAHYWHSWLNRLTNFIGYGVLLVVPVVANTFSEAVAQLLSVIIVLFAFVYAVLTIWHQRTPVKNQLQLEARAATFSLSRIGLGMLARSWHILATIYFAVLAGTMLLQPATALPVILMATVQTLAAIVMGLLLVNLAATYLNQPLQIQSRLQTQYPMLETRLNSFMPKIFQTFRIVVLIAVVAVVLDAWNLFNLPAWLASPVGLHVVATLLTVAAILVVAMLIWIALASWIEHRLNPQGEGDGPTAREKTLLTIFRNASAIALIIMTLMIVLSEIGINIGPLLAGAGVLGLAIGFGAQKLVQDVITGVFIQMENAISVGDVVTAGGLSGTAEKLTIRSMGMRDLSGTYHVIPFSSVDIVSNYMRGFAYHVGEYGVAYREDTDEVIIKLREAFDELLANDEHRSKLLSDELEVHGVTALADSAVNIRVRIKTLPGSQWGIGREYNRLVKRHLDAAGIEIPFPHLTLYFGEDKDGKAPPAPIRVMDMPKKLQQQAESSPQAGSDKRSEANPSYKGDFDEE